MNRPLERRQRVLASVYDHYGEAAQWTQGGGPPTGCVVRRRGGEGLAGYGDSQAIVGEAWMRVRVTEPFEPGRGDLIEIVDTGEKFQVGNRPRKTKTGLEWVIEPIGLG